MNVQRCRKDCEIQAHAQSSRERVQHKRMEGCPQGLGDELSQYNPCSVT